MDLHHPLVETYGAMLHARDQHPRSRFLLLIQALEGLHGFETREEYDLRAARHLTKRDDVVEAATKSLSSKQMRFLKSFLVKSPPTSLDTVLRAMTSGLPVDTLERLGQTELVQQAKMDPSAPATTADALRIVRNSLVHGRRGYDARLLDEAVQILELAVRAHALRILGCPDDVIARVFDDP